VLGLFDGTVDEFHVHRAASEKTYKVGKKVKARVLYNYDSSPPKFALALTDHLLHLKPRVLRDSTNQKTKDMAEAYPIGTILESVKVARVEPDRGIIVDVESGLQGFIHVRVAALSMYLTDIDMQISHLSDDHVPSLNVSGPWKPGSLHRARVIGYFALDGLLQLSLKSSVLNQAFMQVSDVEVGEVVKGTIKKITDSSLFVTISGGIDCVVWPNHYADIALKHPARRFKPGAAIKCRVCIVAIPFCDFFFQTCSRY
jgi:rRNA biogenesis protein RRP5